VSTTVAVFLLQLLVLHRYHEDVVGDELACSHPALRDGRYWTLLTYAWAHAVDLFGDSHYFWLHIVANMIPLVCLGPALEEMLGPLRYFGLYLGGAIASVLFWLCLNSHSNDPIIGASGAVFAVIAGIAAAAPREEVDILLLGLIPLHASMSVVALVICGIELAQIGFQYVPWLARFAMPQVAHSAHLGGAAFGAVYTWLVLPRRGPDLTR
jgi:membrane associated rhomboid family serine protease